VIHDDMLHTSGIHAYWLYWLIKCANLFFSMIYCFSFNWKCIYLAVKTISVFSLHVLWFCNSDLTYVLQSTFLYFSDLLQLNEIVSQCIKFIWQFAPVSLKHVSGIYHSKHYLMMSISLKLFSKHSGNFQSSCDTILIITYMSHFVLILIKCCCSIIYLMFGCHSIIVLVTYLRLAALHWYLSKNLFSYWLSTNSIPVCEKKVSD